jgi:hypothetical protein
MQQEWTKYRLQLDILRKISVLYNAGSLINSCLNAYLDLIIANSKTRVLMLGIFFLVGTSENSNRLCAKMWICFILRAQK